MKITTQSKSLTLLAVFLVFTLAACSAFSPGAEATPTNVPVSEVATTSLVENQVSLAQSPTVSVASEPAPQIQSSTSLEADLIQLYQQANPSVVYIITPSGSGSGFVYSQDGYIVTNNHVVEGSNSFEVVFSNGDRENADLIGADVDGDLAVIQVSSLPDGVQPLTLAEPDTLQVGQFVAAIGNPFGEQGSMSFGIVSGLGRSLPSQRGVTGGSTYSLPEVIQTDAPINPGNSGGPLLNLSGEVVGINAAIESQSGTSSGVGFSIPVAAVRLIVPSLIQSGSYQYPYIGASFASEIGLQEQTQLGLPQTQGAYLVEVTPGSPADQAGLQAADPTTGEGGDLIVAIDGQPIQNFGDLNSYLVFHTQPGQTIQLSVLRGGQQITLQLTLGTRP
ncbi:MAG: trypsin-like peptidase domain-containing protein [Anaerolineales bacterium]